MEIKRYDSGLLHSSMYVIEENGSAVVIDPCPDTSPAAGLKVEYLIITHEHYDHISGVNAWKEHTGAPLICSRTCADSIGSPRKNMSKYFELFCSLQTWMSTEGMNTASCEYRCGADITFEDKIEISWQGHTLRLLEIPGHSVGSIGIYLDGNDFFSGDSLLEGCETELRLPGGTVKGWEECGRERIESIPRGTVIHPGHFDRYVL